ncbi:MAG: hypothetical protein FWE59_04385, partial [Oscillospiraceae bacterium]|nr:hypothetical protein [Oscillospiraceae bacterium]
MRSRRSAVKPLAFLLAVVLLAGAVFCGVGGVFGNRNAVSALSPLSRYAQYENGTLLDEGVLIYYTVAELKLLCGAAVTNGSLFDADTRSEVLAQLPFSEPVGLQFMDKYDDGTAWYLVDTVRAIYEDTEAVLPEPSVAYLVTNKGVAGLQFIFITRNDEQFSVHIDTYDTSATVKTALTEYSEIPAPAPPPPAPAPPPPPQPSPPPGPNGDEPSGTETTADPGDDGSELDTSMDDGGTEPGVPVDGAGLDFELGSELGEGQGDALSDGLGSGDAGTMGEEDPGLIQPMSFVSPEPGDIIGEDGTVLHVGEIDITSNAFVANFPVMIANVVIIDQEGDEGNAYGQWIDSYNDPNFKDGQVWTYKV